MFIVPPWPVRPWAPQPKSLTFVRARQSRYAVDSRLAATLRKPERCRQNHNASARKADETNRSRLSQNIAFTSWQADCCRAGDDVVQRHAVANGRTKSLSRNQGKLRKYQVGGRRLLKIRQEDIGGGCGAG